MTGFHALLPPVLTLTVLTIALIFLLWQEWKRPVRFRAFRIIAVIFMLTALAAIILRPTYHTQASSRILLLTPGYTPTVVDSVLKTNPGLLLKHTPTP